MAEVLDRKSWILVSLLLILALALRFCDLTGESLWYDESYSVWTSAMDIASPRILWDWQIEFPLYYWLLHVWMKLFGQGAFAVRAMSALAGALTVVPLVWLGRDLFGRRAGLIAGLLLAVNPYHVWYSQEARMYSCAVLLATASTYAFWRLVRGGRWGWWLVHALLTGLTFHLHYYVGWLVLAENLFYLGWTWHSRGGPCQVKFWRALRPWIGDQLVVLLLALPAFAVFLTKAVGLNQWGWLGQRFGRPGWREVATLFSAYTVGTAFPGPGTLRWLILGLFVGVAFWGGIALWRKRSPGGNIEALFWVLLWLGLPLVATFVLGQFRPVWVPRYLLLFLPAFLLLVALGLEKLPARWVVAAVVVLTLGSASGLAGMYGGQQKEDWRGVAGYVAARSAPDDILVLIDKDCRVPWEYYSRGDERRIEVSRFADAEALDRVVGQIGALQGAKRLWVVASHADPAGLVARLDGLSDWDRVESPTFVGVELFVYHWLRG